MCCVATAANKPVLFDIQRRRNDFEAQLHTERSPANGNFEFHSNASSSTQCSVFKSEINEDLADLVPSLPLASCTAEAGHLLPGKQSSYLCHTKKPPPTTWVSTSISTERGSKNILDMDTRIAGGHSLSWQSSKDKSASFNRLLFLRFVTGVWQ